MFPPGRAKLVTKPASTATMGIVVVAFLALAVVKVPPCDDEVDLLANEFGHDV
jgi:hypothetical protein